MVLINALKVTKIVGHATLIQVATHCYLKMVGMTMKRFAFAFIIKEMVGSIKSKLFRNHCTVKIVNQRLTCFFFDFFRCKEH